MIPIISFRFSILYKMGIDKPNVGGYFHRSKPIGFYGLNKL